MRIIIATVALLAVNTWGQTNTITPRFYTNIITGWGISFTNYPQPLSITNLVFVDGKGWIARTDGRLEMPVTESGVTNIIKELVASGKFCRVEGHRWAEINKRKRICAVCLSEMIGRDWEWEEQ